MKLYKDNNGLWVVGGKIVPQGKSLLEVGDAITISIINSNSILFRGQIEELQKENGDSYADLDELLLECKDFFSNPLNPLKEDVEGLQGDVEQLQIDVSAIQGGYLGTLLHTDAAPEPGVSGIYKFISAGVVSWLSGTPTVAVGDEVYVAFTDPTYTYTYIKNDNEQLVNKQNSLTVDGTGVKYPTVDAVNDALSLKADSIDLIETKQSISTLESVLSDANINQEAQVTASGVDTVSLPKTAANTGMQVQLFGQSAENLVVNGDFRDGLTGWSYDYPVPPSVSSQIVTLTAPTSFRYFVSDININAEDKIYVRRSSKSSEDVVPQVASFSGTPTYATRNLILSSLGDTPGIFVEKSTIYTSLSNTDKLGFYTFPATSGVAEVKYLLAINLTATFGAGNEPTKEQCDLLFANYFEGSDNVLGTGRIRSVNSAGLIPSYLYFNGGQLRSNGLTKDEIRKGTNGYELVKRVGVGTLGDELITNAADREFTSDTGFWTKVAGALIEDGVMKPGSSDNSGIYRNSLLGLGKNYFVKVNQNINTSRYLYSLDNASSLELRYNKTGINRRVIRNNNHTAFRLCSFSAGTIAEVDSVSVREVTLQDGQMLGGFANNNVTEMGDGTILYTLATPVITPIAHAGIMNSNSNGTVYFEPIIADAGVYSSNLAIQLTDYPIASFESIRKYANGTYTELNTATAVIASGGLSFTHPDLVSGDLVMFTYAYSRESIGRSMTLTHYDNRYVKVDTANGKTYRIDFVVTNGVVVPTATEV